MTSRRLREVMDLPSTTDAHLAKVLPTGSQQQNTQEIRNVPIPIPGIYPTQRRLPQGLTFIYLPDITTCLFDRVLIGKRGSTNREPLQHTFVFSPSTMRKNSSHRQIARTYNQILGIQALLRVVGGHKTYESRLSRGPLTRGPSPDTH